MTRHAYYRRSSRMITAGIELHSITGCGVYLDIAPTWPCGVAKSYTSPNYGSEDEKSLNDSSIAIHNTENDETAPI